MVDATQAGHGGVRHAMLLYRSPGEHAQACSEHVMAGAADRAAILAAGPAAHMDLLRSRLADAADLVEMTELTSHGADPGRVLSMLRMFAREHAGRPLRLVQDVGWSGRPDEDLAEAIGYEALLCSALAGSDADVLCAYDAGLSPAVLAAAERAHQFVLDDGRRPSDRRGGPPDSGPPESGPPDSGQPDSGQPDGGPPDSGQPDSGRSGGAASRGGLAGPLSAPPESASSLTFRSDQAAVRRFASDEGKKAGLPPSRVTDLVIAVAELAGNTFRHTDGPGTLRIWTTAVELICQVSDDGHIADLLTGTIRPDPAATGSQRGLWLVHQVGDLVQVRSGPSGTTVRVHLRLSVGGGRSSSASASDGSSASASDGAAESPVARLSRPSGRS